MISTSSSLTRVLINIPAIPNSIKEHLERDNIPTAKLLHLAVAHALRYSDKDIFTNRIILNKELSTQIGIVLREYPKLSNYTEFLVRVKKSIVSHPCLSEVSDSLLDSYRITRDGRELVLCYK